jgi:hypothetical protein
MLLPTNAQGDMNPMKSQFLALAISDTPLFHATISFAALHLALVTQESPIAVQKWKNATTKAPAYNVHKDEAVQCLKGRTFTTETATDAFIGAFIMLASFEV